MLNKILIKLKEKYQNSPLFQEGGILAPAKADEAKVKISFLLRRLGKAKAKSKKDFRRKRL